MADLAAALATRARWSEQGLKVLRHQHRLTPESLSAELRRLAAAGVVELSRDPRGLLVVRPTTRREAPEPAPVEITTPAEEGAVLDARPCPDCGTGCRDGACRCDDEPTPPEPPTAPASRCPDCGLLGCPVTHAATTATATPAPAVEEPPQPPEALAKIRRAAPWLLDHLTGATTRPKIKAPPREKDPQPMAKDLPDDDKPTDTPTPYGALRSRVLAALCRHPEGVVVKALAPEVGTHQSTVRSTLQRALREGTAARQGQLWLPTATTATAPPSVRPRPPIPQPGQRHREGKLLILDALAARGGQRHGELLAETGLPPATLSREMRRLIEAGRVTKAGQTYSLAAPVAVAAPPAPAPAPKAPPPRPAAPVAVAVAPTGRLAAARAAVAALSPEELDALLASLAPVVEARRALDAALAGLRA